LRYGPRHADPTEDFAILPHELLDLYPRAFPGLNESIVIDPGIPF
jgi:hypothetical protein